jgi:glycosyltransferase involved in cell wall biosynthesis
MSHPFKVSVIIPTFNRRDHISKAITSVLQQTRLPDEILIIDDGSTDDTPKRLPHQFPQTRYIRQDNMGVSAARNRGIEESSGDWLAFLDSDDEWLPRKLERQVEALTRAPHFQMCHTNEIWIRNGRRVNPMKKHEKHGGNIFRYCLPLCVISPSSVILHRSVFERVGRFDEQLPVCEDYDLWLRITPLYPVLYLDEPFVVKHGGHPDQLSRSLWGMDRFRIRALEKVIRSGVLSPEARREAVDMLLAKTDVYVNGARRREKHNEVEVYKAKRERFEKLSSNEAL